MVEKRGHARESPREPGSACAAACWAKGGRAERKNAAAEPSRGCVSRGTSVAPQRAGASAAGEPRAGAETRISGTWNPARRAERGDSSCLEHFDEFRRCRRRLSLHFAEFRSPASSPRAAQHDKLTIYQDQDVGLSADVKFVAGDLDDAQGEEVTCDDSHLAIACRCHHVEHSSVRRSA